MRAIVTRLMAERYGAGEDAPCVPFVAEVWRQLGAPIPMPRAFSCCAMSMDDRAEWLSHAVECEPTPGAIVDINGTHVGIVIDARHIAHCKPQVGVTIQKSRVLRRFIKGHYLPCLSS